MLMHHQQDITYYKASRLCVLRNSLYEQASFRTCWGPVRLPGGLLRLKTAVITIKLPNRCAAELLVSKIFGENGTFPSRRSCGQSKKMHLSRDAAKMPAARSTDGNPIGHPSNGSQSKQFRISCN